MKVVKAQEMGRIEKLAYFRGASEEAFMEKAGEGVCLSAKAMLSELRLSPSVCLLCGPGNNAGDAFVAGRLLKEQGVEVTALALCSLPSCSSLCQTQARRFIDAGGEIFYVEEGKEFAFQKASLLIDGILGTGFHGEVEGRFKAVIHKANVSKIPILSIDIPSGINGNSGVIGGGAIEADVTLMLGLPKVGCFLGEAWNFVGNIQIYNFGLSDACINEAQEEFILLNDGLIEVMLPKSKRSQHKYQAGYVVGLGGSFGMPGAPMLAGEAALKAGAGIVRILHPTGMEAELSAAPYELVRQGYEKGDDKAILKAMEKASSVFFGPGIGISEETLELLKRTLPLVDKSCVIDAEALTLLAHHDIKLPEHTVMTPHIGEMMRLLHRDQMPPTFGEFLDLCQHFASEKKVVLVVKGAPTFIFHPTSTPLICHRGDRGMATAGSGDVLTGIISAFLAEKIPILDAAALGVYVHAVAGECAAQEKTSTCMTARTITENLPRVFHYFQQSSKKS